jgi:cytochrome b involved in lipid metabolism
MIKKSMIFLIILAVFLSSCSEQQSEQPDEILPPSPEMESEPRTKFIITEIAMHDSKDDCWLLIDGKVYEVTDFIRWHPGKDAILEGCGKDATTLYETRPMGSGTPHSQSARNRLEQYKIGELMSNGP